MIQKEKEKLKSAIFGSFREPSKSGLAQVDMRELTRTYCRLRALGGAFQSLKQTRLIIKMEKQMDKRFNTQVYDQINTKNTNTNAKK